MTCRDFQDRIMTDYLDNEAPADVRKKVEEHLSQCALCREHLSVVRKLDVDLKSAAPGEPPEHVWAMIRDQIQTKPVSLGERLRTWWEEVIWGFRPAFAYGSIAAAALVLLVVLVPMNFQRGNRLAHAEKEEVARLAYLDEESSFISEAEEVGSGTLVENWL